MSFLIVENQQSQCSEVFETTICTTTVDVRQNEPTASTSVSRQTTMTDYTRRPATLNRQKQTSKVLMEMIAKDMQPMSIVQDKGFRKWCLFLGPSCVLPNRTTLCRTILPQTYESCVEKVRNQLGACKYVTITTDGWKSLTGQSFLAITAHFVSEDWELKTFLLNCFNITDRHTSVNIRNHLISEANKWNITKKIHLVVTDNAANMVAAVKLTGWDHFACFAHTINLIVKDAIQLISDLQKKK